MMHHTAQAGERRRGARAAMPLAGLGVPPDSRVKTTGTGPMNLSTFTRQVALRQPDHPALLWEGAQLSYAGFEDQTARIAGGLIHRHGLAPGARVAMTMENCPEFLPVLFGIWRAGLTAVPMGPGVNTSALQRPARPGGDRRALPLTKMGG